MSELVSNYLKFLWDCASSYHVVEESRLQLLEAGFTQLREREEWDLKPASKYFFIRDQSSIFAFITPTNYTKDVPCSIIGAHTDSPTLKIKPMSDASSSGHEQLAVEPYGSLIFSSWFDRPLRVAGRVIVRSEGKLQSRLVRIDTPIALIPNLAIHNWPTRQSPPKLDLSKHIMPLVSCEKKEHPLAYTHEIGSIHPQSEFLLSAVEACLAEQGLKEFSIVSWDLEFSNANRPVRCGTGGQILLAQGHDNRLHSYAALRGICEMAVPAAHIPIVALFNNEEVGSTTREGARGPTVSELVKRISGSLSIPKSFFLSADGAHGLHPNYASASDTYSISKLGHGIALKVDARQGYSSGAPQTAYIMDVAKSLGIRLQMVAKKNGTPGGGTIGPMSAAVNAIRTVDMGVLMLGMHSIAETAHAGDFIDTAKLSRALLERPGFPAALLDSLE
eukprot:gnl/Chilomastix_cuspidata/1013.p1 GENE.gnl/Chilomastix_cuspidata/1013~~gnl/Chilomastix_cuspidata/1013.p1  ORF type:complete len:460 (-),score=145.83 gnl/Chilomastix_cuspidata/1013:38-1378(-)